MADATKPSIDLRGWALCIWAESQEGGVKPDAIYGARAGKVALMEAAGWIERRDGALFLSERGQGEIEALKPAAMPKLTMTQREFLEEVIDKKGMSADMNYPPVLKLVAYGALKAKAQRFGGLRLDATEMALEWDAARQEPAPSPGPR